MRKIKFRAKVKMPEKRNFARQEYVPEGQWVYGEPHTIDCPIPHIHTLFVGKQPVDKETIEQFTGVKDINGREIYEGDIVRVRVTNDRFKKNPRFCNGVVSFCSNDGGWTNGCYFRFLPARMEVIGNIHDNPELLKGGDQ
ncbi:MAG: YopX family protein [Prevotella sp.]|nr:YopX family protein [Prevotella sp.]